MLQILHAFAAAAAALLLEEILSVHRKRKEKIQVENHSSMSNKVQWLLNCTHKSAYAIALDLIR